MNPSLRHSRGFTIIELALVLIVVGIFASALIPLASDVHDNSLRETDDTRMQAIRDALLGYIRITEEIPCVDAAGLDASTGCDAANTLGLLGTRITDSKNKTFIFDVNDTLTANEIAVSGNSICTALAEIINPAVPPATPPEPNVCDSANANTGNAACAAANPMAFVLVGRGSDRCLNLENTHATSANDAVCTTAVADNRTFENQARRRSREADDAYYDDLVLTVTPTELAEVLGCPAGGGGGGSVFSVCASNEVLAQVSNGDNSAMSIQVGGSCYVISEGTTASMGCQPEATNISVYANQSCTSIIANSSLDVMDSNDDGRADIVCDNTNACSWR